MENKITIYRVRRSENIQVSMLSNDVPYWETEVQQQEWRDSLELEEINGKIDGYEEDIKTLLTNDYVNEPYFVIKFNDKWTYWFNVGYEEYNLNSFKITLIQDKWNTHYFEVMPFINGNVKVLRNHTDRYKKVNDKYCFDLNYDSDIWNIDTQYANLNKQNTENKNFPKSILTAYHVGRNNEHIEEDAWIKTNLSKFYVAEDIIKTNIKMKIDEGYKEHNGEYRFITNNVNSESYIICDNVKYYLVDNEFKSSNYAYFPVYNNFNNFISDSSIGDLVLFQPSGVNNANLCFVSTKDNGLEVYDLPTTQSAKITPIQKIQLPWRNKIDDKRSVNNSELKPYYVMVDKNFICLVEQPEPDTINMTDRNYLIPGTIDKINTTEADIIDIEIINRGLFNNYTWLEWKDGSGTKRNACLMLNDFSLYGGLLFNINEVARNWTREELIPFNYDKEPQQFLYNNDINIFFWNNELYLPRWQLGDALIFRFQNDLTKLNLNVYSRSEMFPNKMFQSVIELSMFNWSDTYRTWLKNSKNSFDEQMKAAEMNYHFASSKANRDLVNNGFGLITSSLTSSVGGGLMGAMIGAAGGPAGALVGAGIGAITGFFTGGQKLIDDAITNSQSKSLAKQQIEQLQAVKADMSKANANVERGSLDFNITYNKYGMNNPTNTANIEYWARTNLNPFSMIKNKPVETQYKEWIEFVFLNGYASGNQKHIEFGKLINRERFNFWSILDLQNALPAGLKVNNKTLSFFISAFQSGVRLWDMKNNKKIDRQYFKDNNLELSVKE